MTPLTQAGARSRRMRWLLFVALLVGAAAAAFWLREPAPPAPPPLPSHSDPAVVKALTEARQDVLNQPRSVEARAKLAMTLYANDCVHEAALVFAQAELLDPTDYRWPYFQAVLLLHGQPDDALKKAQRAQELAPQHAGVHILASEVHFSQRRPDDALPALQAALRLDADNPYALLGWARWAASQAKLDEARSHAERVVSDHLVAKAANLLLAEVLHRAGRMREAQEHLRLAQRLPDDPPRTDPIMEDVARCRVGIKAAITQGDRLVQQGELSEAIAVQQKAVADYPENYKAFLALGNTLALRGTRRPDADGKARDFAAAETALTTAARLAPDNLRVQFHLGLLNYEQRTDPAAAQRAASVFESVVRKQPDNNLAAQLLGECLKLQRNWAKAEIVFRKLTQLRPDLPDAYVGLAEVQERQGKRLDASVSWLQAYALDADNRRVQTRLLLAAVAVWRS
jgi:tetratricopeptide (TPR) repeat protein